MPTSRSHYNASCPGCVRQASRTARLDWLGCVDLSTEPSPLGEVPVGEIVVVDRWRKRLFTAPADYGASTPIPRAARAKWRAFQVTMVAAPPFRAHSAMSRS